MHPQHFAISLFKTEQEIYAAEGIMWPGVEWEDNSECIEVIAGKAPSSIFNSLTEHSRRARRSHAQTRDRPDGNGDGACVRGRV